jgi:hypothetical protein
MPHAIDYASDRDIGVWLGAGHCPCAPVPPPNGTPVLKIAPVGRVAIPLHPRPSATPEVIADAPQLSVGDRFVASPTVSGTGG